MHAPIRYALPLVAAAAFALLSACSAADTASSQCTTSDECESGLACQTDGTCGEVPCSLGCVDGEICLQLDADGNYDPSEEGVCTAVECGGGRGGPSCPEGFTCINGGCYEGTSDPVPCGCSTECPSGQTCIAGVCGTETTGCLQDCECLAGQTCDEGTCTGEVVTDLCEGVTCDPGLVCDPATGSCVDDGGGSSGNLCDPCASDAECGSEADGCVALGDGSFCGSACTGEGDCPDGYTCFRVDSVIGEQCVPAGGSCGGCLATGCDAGQFCNSATEVCEPVAATCAPCAVENQCGPDAACAQLGGRPFCLPTCDAGCDAGFTCGDVGGRDLCVPDAGSCDGSSCELSAGDCTGDTPILDAASCACVECRVDDDCGAGQVCSPGGACITSGAPCESITDCPAGQICDTRVDTCVECITPGDCPSGQICNSGVCEECVCDPGFRCDLAGDCVETGDPADCGSDSECEGFARDLGGTGEGATCDSEIGCYTIGACNGSLLGGGGGLPIPDLGDFGGTTDPFDAPCPPGTTCDILIELDLGGSGEFFTFACKGCDETNPDACREGEVCTTPLLPFPDDTPYCAGDGGGFPFPFP